MLADLRFMLETDWNDEKPELTFFCQGGDGRAYQVTPEHVGVEEKPLLVGTLMEFSPSVMLRATPSLDTFL